MKSTRVYNFSIPAGGSFQLPVTGSYFRVMTATDVLEVQGDTFGNIYPLYTGQGLQGQEFRSLNLLNRTGATNNGSILVSDGKFVDDRITGEVSIIDGGKSRTFSNSAYVSNAFSVALAAQLPHCQLWNPVASLKNIVIQNFDVSTNVTGPFQFNINNIALTTTQANGTNKLSGSAASIGESRVQMPATELLTSFMGSGQLTANSAPYRYDFREPVILKPGYGFVVTMNNTVSVNLTTVIQYYEDLL